MTMGLRSNRRRFMQGLGASLAGLPFLRSLPSQAAPGDHPRRLIVFFSGNEPIGKSYWKPAGDGSEFALTSLKPMMQSLEPLRDKLTIIGEMALKTREKETFGAGHVGVGHLLTGRTVSPYGSGNAEFWGGGVSVDQFIASRLGVNALTLGARPGGNNGNSRISYLGKDQPVHPIDDPLKAFDKMFGGLGGDDPEKAALRARKKSVLDFVAKDLEAAKAGLSSA
ncbi:MAG: DUF1552 domain-containing protein, partial [Myxococcales bacterium]|nr:DUF1552 domain-containing protein [Myxococcales bacterium]